MRQSETIGGFRIIARLSESERTETLLAHDRNLDREVVITRLTAFASRDQASVESFRRRAEQLGRIQHPNVVPIHAIDLMPSQPYFVTARVDGETLDAVLRQRGPLELGESIQIVLDALDGLEAAHGQCANHGRLAPSAVFIERSQGRALLGDFEVMQASDSRPQGPKEHRGDRASRSSRRWPGRDREQRDDLRCLGRLFLLLLTKDQVSRSGVAPDGMEYDVVSARLPDAHAHVDAPPAVWELVYLLLSDSSETDALTAASVRERLARVRLDGSTGILPRRGELSEFSVLPDGPLRSDSLEEPRPFQRDRGKEPVLSRCFQYLRSIVARACNDLRRNQRRPIDLGEDDRQLSILLGYRKDGLAVLANLTDRNNNAQGPNGTLLAAIAEQRRELTEIDRLIRRCDRKKARRSRYLSSVVQSADRQFDSVATTPFGWMRRLIVIAGIALVAIVSVTLVPSTQSLRSQRPSVASMPVKAVASTPVKTEAGLIIDQYYELGRLFTQESSSPLHESRTGSRDVVALAFDPSRERLHAVTGGGILETTFVADGLRQKPFSPWPDVAAASPFPGTDLVAIRHRSSADEQRHDISIVDPANVQGPLLRLFVSKGERVVGVQPEPFRLWTLDSDGQQHRLQEYDSEGQSAWSYLFDEDVSSVVVGRDATFVAALGDRHEYELIERRTGARSRLVPSRRVEAIAIDVAGHWLATHGRSDPRVDLFSARTNRIEATLNHEQPVRHIQFDREGRRLAVATDRDVRIWDLALCYVRIRIPAADARLMRFSADGGRLAVLRESGDLSVWNTEFPVLHTRRRKNADVVGSPGFGGRDTSAEGKESSNLAQKVTADGRLTVRWTPDEGAVLEESDSGHVLLKYSFTTPSVVAISPNDRLVAFGRVDEGDEQAHIAICDLRTGRQNCEMRIAAKYLFCLEFSRGQDLLYGGGLRTVYAWDVATGNATTQYTTLIPYVYRVHQSLDGRRLIFSDYQPDRPVGGVGTRVHAIDSGELLWDASVSEWPNLIRPLEEMVDTRFGGWETAVQSSISAENK